MCANKELREDFLIFRDQCIILQRDYNNHCILFDDSNHELLRSIAKIFFTDLSELMRNYWIIQAHKILDSRKDSLSINSIHKSLNKLNPCNSEINSLYKKIKIYADIIKNPRNKLVAHACKEHYREDKDLHMGTESEINNFLNNLQDYCNCVGKSIDVGPLDFSSSNCSGDVIDFIRYLKKTAIK